MMNVVGTIAVYLVLFFGVSEECNSNRNVHHSIRGRAYYDNNHDWEVHIEYSARFKRSSEVKSKERKFHVEMEYDGNNQHKTPLNPCVFNPYDSNGKGYITKSDLEKIFVNYNDGVNTPEILHNLFAELDIDEDKMVTKEEFNIMRDDVISEESCKRKENKDGRSVEKNKNLTVSN
ncbi:Hypothetical predicted protein [Mytilus galloprovincialis]|uniref:EF-hand domain-containing protein n=2 Tax=Mytilus galloprovincialis TaxID=29158 RepID=A0A8B6D7G6_MYTGA|nr:Hypothetical predicted protein [Mytilus galloprovincialis]